MSLFLEIIKERMILVYSLDAFCVMQRKEER